MHFCDTYLGVTDWLISRPGCGYGEVSGLFTCHPTANDPKIFWVDLALVFFPLPPLQPPPPPLTGLQWMTGVGSLAQTKKGMNTLPFHRLTQH